MHNDFLLGNEAFAEKETVAYIIGDTFEVLSQLPAVYTLKQFFKLLLENRLPTHRIWIVGQGIRAAVREVLSFCGEFRPDVHFHFGSLSFAASLNDELLSPPAETPAPGILEWQDFHFIDAARVKADLKLSQLSDMQLLAQDFLLIAARELSEQACRQTVPGGQLLVKQANIHRFHQLLPLPITVETQFQLTNDNKRSLKSLTRFYQKSAGKPILIAQRSEAVRAQRSTEGQDDPSQHYSCAAEVNLSFDLYSAEEAKQLLQTLGVKTFGHFSDKINEEN